MRLAAQDFEAAQILSDKGLWPVSCFHAQQAAEKGLKAVLAARNQPFPKTHDLERLAALIGESLPGFPSLAEHCAVLNEYAVTARYDPGAAWGIDHDETLHALHLSREVLGHCRTAVERERADPDAP